MLHAFMNPDGTTLYKIQERAMPDSNLTMIVSVGSKRYPEKPIDSMAGFFEHLKTTQNQYNNDLKTVNIAEFHCGSLL